MSQRVDLPTRLRTLFPATVSTWLGLTVAICVPYFVLGRIQLRGSVRVPETVIDAAVPFSPAWVWVYLSIALLVAAAPALARSHAQLRAFRSGLLALIVPSFVCFLLLPVPGPRPPEAIDPGQGWLFAWLVSVDTVWNSFPSLHAGLTAFALAYMDRVWLQEEGARTRTAGRCVFVLWGVGILYATLATKQHWLWDLPPGVLLGALAAGVAHRSLAVEPARV